MKATKVRIENTQENIDLERDQHLLSIRKNGERLGDIEILEGKITTKNTCYFKTMNFLSSIFSLLQD